MNELICIADNTNICNLEMKFPIKNALEVANIIVVYGLNMISLLQLNNSNNKYEIKELLTQTITEDTSILSSLLFYPSKNLFIGGHESGNLSAWSAGDKGLALLAITGIGKSVKNYLFFLYYFSIFTIT